MNRVKEAQWTSVYCTCGRLCRFDPSMDHSKDVKKGDSKKRLLTGVLLKRTPLVTFLHTMLAMNFIRKEVSKMININSKN